MSKRVEITDHIRRLIAKATDEAVNPDDVVVYETIAVNTLPVNSSGLYKGSRLDAGVMYEMESFLNNGGNVPLHQIHDQAEALPVGKVFHGKARTRGDGETELRALFYLPNKSQSEKDLISKIDNDVVGEVSVGVLPRTLNCSECGFDFLGAEATWDNIWTLTCNENHTVGVNGVFTHGRGLKNWLELSLVSRGAANNAKILSRTKQLLGDTEYNRLAASGIKPEATALFTIAPKETSMDTKELILELTNAKGAGMLKDSEIAALKATQTTLTTERDALKVKVDELSKPAADLTAAQAQVTTLTASHKEVLDYTRAEAVRLAGIAGTEKPADDAAFPALKASIDLSRAKLKELPVGGAADPASSGTGGDTTPKHAPAASFKIQK